MVKCLQSKLTPVGKSSTGPDKNCGLTYVLNIHCNSKSKEQIHILLIGLFWVSNSRTAHNCSLFLETARHLLSDQKEIIKCSHCALENVKMYYSKAFKHISVFIKYVPVTLKWSFLLSAHMRKWHLPIAYSDCSARRRKGWRVMQLLTHVNLVSMLGAWMYW